MAENSFLIDVTCLGFKPLMQEAMPIDLIERVLIRGERPPKVRDASLKEMAAKVLYHGPNGELGIPTDNLFACLVEAGRLVKYDNKKFISTTTSTLLPSFLTIMDEFLPFPEGTAWEPDIRRGQMQDSTTVGIVRPKFRHWSFTCTLRADLEDTPVTEETLKKLLRFAGRAIGLCSFRPAKKGQFGQFEITAWKRREID